MRVSGALALKPSFPMSHNESLPLLAAICVAFALPAARLQASGESPDPGLLFYLSADKGTTADVAAPGTSKPTFEFQITQIPDGAKGAALSCGDVERLAYRAPGNIYAQRGTLAFDWRSRYPVGPTEFPVFRVGYADHSSWDMVFLRIDYNGHGFDAFVTDANLSRVRVSVPLDPFPKPNEWIHLSLAWDETEGIRFYINGKLAAKKDARAVLYDGLNQFGPHSRIIAPWQVQSDYNFVRGGDIDEVRIYDRMLDDAAVAAVARGDSPQGLSPTVARDLSEPRWRDEWWMRYGWNRPDDPPPYLKGALVSIRKVEIHDAYDLKRWYWKACDGIPETTWPGVYNRSRLPGRNDYFQLPDWDCYSLSGKSITFYMPDEPWNHLEIAGAAWGKMSLLKPDGASDTAAERVLFDRPQGQEKTVHVLSEAITGRKIRFDNVMQEQPIAELSAYNVTAGSEPAGTAKLRYRLSSAVPEGDSLAPLVSFIAGRYAPDERSMMVAEPVDRERQAQASAAGASPALPLVHILIPCDGAGVPGYRLDAVDGGLDGIAIDLPALKVRPTHGDLFPLNIQVKDPIWPMRNMFDFTFSVKPGEAKTLWLDLRDRILAPGKGFYLTIAGAGADFGPDSLAGAEIRLVFKPRQAARAEHELDRFTQVRDVYAMLVEEHPFGPLYDMWERFQGDVLDLLRVNPNHYPGRNYWTVAMEVRPDWAKNLPDSTPPPFAAPTPPAGVPEWAFLQAQALKHASYFVNWWIDHRQVENGEMGGGLSDDTDLTNVWPGMALMGINPDKLGHSVRQTVDACYRQGMITNGLCTIRADELHSYEEGLNALGQNMILNYGSPKMVERAMENARAIEWLSGINPLGHRFIRSCDYNGLKMATDEPWGYTKAYSYLSLQPAQLLVEFNGNPEARKILLELADGLLSRRRQRADGQYVLPTAVRFSDEHEAIATRAYFPWPLFWSAYKWTGDRKYMDPIYDGGVTYVAEVNANVLDLLDLRKAWGPRFIADEKGRILEGRVFDARGIGNHPDRVTGNEQFVWQLTGDKKQLVNLYTRVLHEMVLLEYINTDGQLWIDRVGVPYAELQRSRLGGVALVRNGCFPGHVVSWRFAAPANEQSAGILVPHATRTEFKVIAYNLETTPIRTTMTGWDVDPGLWDMTQGIDTKDADVADSGITSATVPFARSQSVELTLAPRATTVLTFKLRTQATPYWQRPDLGIDPEDIQIHGREVRITIHNLGAAASPETNVVLRDAAGEQLAVEKVPSIAAPLDLRPKTINIRATLAEGASLQGGSVEIDPDHRIEEITRLNNRVGL
jgi:hypothetical protein